MPDRHEPREAFVTRLQSDVTAEVRRRQRSAPADRATPWPRWLLHSPLRAALSMVALVMVSMAIGGGIVAASYQAEARQMRDLLVANYRQRAALASERVTLVRDQLRTAEQRVSVGIEGQDAVFEARFKVNEAEAQARLVQLQLEEVMASGREPQGTVSSPLVSGRDFVTERWQIEMSIPTAAFDVAKKRLDAVTRRVAVGMADPIDVETVRTQLMEIEATIVAWQRKLDVRQQVLKKTLEAPVAELRVLELDAEQRVQTLTPRIALAKTRVQNVAAKQNTGAATSIELAEAQLRLQELTLEMMKTNVELMMVQRQMQLRRGK
jgi:outer membrane protein TolC